MNQKGFATLEVILMVVVIGILASVAVPRFTDITTKANTAKIQADLSTLDSAIQIYYMDKGTYPSSVNDLVNNGYLNDVVNPPTGGAAYVKDSEEPKPLSQLGTIYEIKKVSVGTTSSETYRAMLGNYVAGDFYKKTSSTNSGTSDTSSSQGGQ